MVMQETANVAPEQPLSSWVIDLEWYEKNNRSFVDLARRSLCSKCSEKLQKKKKKISAGDIVDMVKNCCSRGPDFITARLPILESTFRVLLAKGNQPMDTVALSEELSLRRGGEAYTVSPEVLYRLLSNDRWYGFKQVVDEES
ncbi:MAG: hypothetical protein JW967_06615 [Dehalococcoidales bacterium]|nr:hypothetical protein [Dehalococcoidales bacterium]